MIEISVVIPCLNEEKTLETCIKKCLKSFEELKIEGEIIVSDNGSEDRSVKIAEDLGVKVVHCKEKGYGNTLKTGFSEAKGKYIVMGDADDSYNFLAIPDYYKALNPDIDMVIGTRIKGKIHKGAMPFLNRYLGTPVLTFVLNLLYGTKISDSQCGMRLMKKEALDKIRFTTTGMEFASELLVEFAKHKFKIVEIPIELFQDAKGRKPHLRPFRDGLRHLYYLFTNII